MLDGLGEVVFRTDPEGNWTYLSAAWTRIFGFDIASSLGTNFMEYVHPDERERTIALFMAVVAGGADYCHHEGRYRSADGRYRWIELRSQVIRDDEGRVIGNTGTLTDRTEGKEAGERLTGQVQALELVARGAAVSDLPMGVARYRPDGTLARASPTLARLFGAAMAPGARVEALFDLPGAEGTAGRALGGDYGLIATARSTGRAQYGDLRLTPEQGTPRTFAVTVLPLGEDPTAWRARCAVPGCDGVVAGRDAPSRPRPPQSAGAGRIPTCASCLKKRCPPWPGPWTCRAAPSSSGSAATRGCCREPWSAGRTARTPSVSSQTIRRPAFRRAWRAKMSLPSTTWTSTTRPNG